MTILDHQWVVYGVIGYLIGIAQTVVLSKLLHALAEMRDQDEYHGFMGSLVKLGYWFRQLTISEVMLVWLTVTMSVVGIFMLVSYGDLKSFEKCEANYNNQSSIATQARSKASVKQINKLFTALGDVLSHPATTPEGRQEQKQEFLDAVQAHEDYLTAIRDNAYPAPPSKVCGSID